MPAGPPFVHHFLADFCGDNGFVLRRLVIGPTLRGHDEGIQLVPAGWVPFVDWREDTPRGNGMQNPQKGP
eukprot:1921320-Lingulodinium_polyedra.AAC.1